jgi:hypothetical protein
MKRKHTHWAALLVLFFMVSLPANGLLAQENRMGLASKTSASPTAYVGSFDGTVYTVYAIDLNNNSKKEVLQHSFKDAAKVKATLNPDSGLIAFTVVPKAASPFWESSLWIGDIDGTEPELFVSDVTANTPIWSANGQHLTYVRLKSMEGTVYHYETYTVDISTGLTESVGMHNAMDINLVSWSNDEQRLYIQEFMNDGEANIWTVYPETGQRDILVNGDLGNLPTSISLSHDGNQLAFVRLERETANIETSVSIIDLTNGVTSTLSQSQLFFYDNVVWSRDGQKLWFSGERSDSEQFLTFLLDVESPGLRVVNAADDIAPLESLPDGRLVAMRSSDTSIELHLFGEENQIVAESDYKDWLGVIYRTEKENSSSLQLVDTSPFIVPTDLKPMSAPMNLSSPSASGNDVANKAQTYVDAQHHYITGGHGQVGNANPYHYVTPNVNNYCHTYPNRGLCTTHRHFDCVGLVWKAFSETGAADKLIGGTEPWTVSSIVGYWETNHPDRIHYDYNWSGRQPGDVVLVNYEKHVGILAAGDRLINASGDRCKDSNGCSGRGVVNDPLSYWSAGFVAYLDIDWGNIPPNPPILQSPANGSNLDSRTVTLSWQDGGDPDNQPNNYRDYVVEVWKSGWNKESGWILPTSWNVTVPEDGVYSWHVKAGDGAVGSEWSETRTFQVETDTTPPTKASNVRPDGWTGPYTDDNTPRFRWGAASDADSGLAGYYVAVDDWTPEGGSGNDWWVGNVTAFTVPNPLPEGQHHFAVTSKDNAGNVNPTNTNHQGDAPYYSFYVDIAPPSTPQLTVSGSGCSGVPNNIWQNTCSAPVFDWSASDGNGSGVKDYRYYWGASASGAPDTVTTDTTFTPGAIAPADGHASMYLNVTARDQLDHESGRASFGVRYDGAAPSVTLQINDGADTTNQVSVRLDLAASDTGSGVSEMRFSDSSLTWSDWEPFVESKSWTLPALDRRAHTVYAQVRDRAGNESPVADDSITLDLYPPMPHSASYRICDDVVNVGGSIGLTSTNYTLVSSIGQPWATGASPNSSTTFDERAGFLAATTGCRPISYTVTSNYTVTQWVIASGGNLRGSVSYRLGDTAGQPAASGHSAFTSTSYVLSSGFWAQITGTVPSTSTQPPVIIPTPTPAPTPGPTPTPQPSGFGVSINDGALYTNDPNVTVHTWAPNVTHARLSNDGAYGDEGWMTYQVTRTWVISTYGSHVMPRYVYVWFKDEQAAVYGPYLDDIIYDPTPPQGNVAILNSSPTTVTLSLEAQDDNSGVAQMRVGETDLASAAWQPYATSMTWTLPSAVVYAQFKDRAGNVSALYGSDGSEHWLASPPLSITLDGPTLGLTNTIHAFSADVFPVSATLPLTYTWQATGHGPITHANTMRGSDALSYTWDVTGVKAITVTALNSLGIATGTHSISIVGATPSCARLLRGVDIQAPGEGSATLYVDTLYAFYAVPTPADATPPITYTWAPMPYDGQGLPAALYQWDTPDTYTVTLTAQNCAGIPFEAQHIVTTYDWQHQVYLPLILRR